MAYLDKLDPPGYDEKRSRSSGGDYRHYYSRPRHRDMLDVACPRCGAPPGQWCDRSDWHPVSPHDLALLAAGTPRSHVQRLWLRQNGQATRPGGRTGMKTLAPVMDVTAVHDHAPCPRCHRSKGIPCPGRPHRERLVLAAQRWRAKQNWRAKRTKERSAR
jgi:hypothetical protein